jgi:hypothetical protein
MANPVVVVRPATVEDVDVVAALLVAQLAEHRIDVGEPKA